jgi:hypothetical protein
MIQPAGAGRIRPAGGGAASYEYVVVPLLIDVCGLGCILHGILCIRKYAGGTSITASWT